MLSVDMSPVQWSDRPPPDRTAGRIDLIWEQAAAGSNPAIPTKSAAHNVCSRLPAWLPRSFDRHMTVELNVNRWQ